MHAPVSDHSPQPKPADGRMRVLALTRYSALAASTRQRFVQFFPALRKAGIDVTLSPLLGDDYVSALSRKKGTSAPIGAYLRRLNEIVLHARHYDALWVQYETFPFLPGSFERMLAVARRPYVVDYDDAIFHNYDLSGGTLRRLVLGHKLAPLLKRAHTCLVGNQYLADYTERYCSDTVIVPTVVDAEHYRPPDTRLAGPLRVGWIGSPSTWRYVEPLLPAIQPVLRRFGATLHVVGARSASVQDEVRFIDWSEDTEIGAVQSFDVGIMPLPDDPWARGKCGYKLIQYMSCGVPCIASPVGVNAEIVTAGQDGLFATSFEDWTGALTTLLADAELRANMGRKGRTKVIERYSLTSQLRPVINVFTAMRSTC